LKILEKFVDEFNTINHKVTQYDNSLFGIVKFAKDSLLNEEFQPSLNLKNVLNKLSIRVKEPMKIAITGQFSSGKSTFLNALISKAILPTGIIPVTSKVNFIKYADEYKLKITYLDGRTEFEDIKNIALFTDQRKNVESIKYLTLYAPLDILEDITFVDTPGLNSRSSKDTKITMDVLRDVDGIIWLTLMDNAGKLSEEKFLNEFMQNSNIKSLCVLNQKDKFSEKQIEKTVNYIKDKFSQYFDTVLPISAKMALQSRQHDKNTIISNKIKQLSEQLSEKLSGKIYEDISFFKQEYEDFKKDINLIVQEDYSKNIKFLEDSNISSVIDFIEKEIRPHANLAKELSIKKDLVQICDIIINQYDIFIKIIDKLINIILDYTKSLDETFKLPKEKYARELSNNYLEFEDIGSKISNEIFLNLIKITKYRYKEVKNSFLSKSHIEKFSYDLPWFDSENIYKNLFYDDDKINKLLKRAIKNLKKIEENANNSIFNTYEKLENSIKSWQNLYELISKNREISSDREFANLRRFVGGVYEHILKDFSFASLKSIANVQNDFGYINGALEFNYQNATKTTVAFFKRRIFESIQFYEEDPVNFCIYQPTMQEISEQIRVNFAFNKIENLIKSKRNFLYKNIEDLQENFTKIAQEKKNFLKSKKAQYYKKIKKLQEIKKQFQV